ncbi:MAG: EAL domain-containing protein, partial [Clostridia bacterium]|nr:EAL domain-containing protein [Clostridia bacterium]
DTVRGSFTDCIAFYDNAMHEKEIYAERLLDEFDAAIDGKQFAIYFQPKYDVRPDTPILCGAEALVRWIHPELGMISPGVFIPLFENNGLIRILDRYVWRETVRHVAEWKKQYGSTVPVSVNVSRIDMLDPDLVGTLRDLVTEGGLDFSDLHLEITESAYTENARQIISTVNELREIGFVIEMDDFGSGYSSLNMIATLPIDVLKLDMVFIRSVFRENGNLRMLKVIVEIAETLSVPMIAEGVEKAEQLNTLRDMGCAMVQGYYFSPPLPAADFEKYVRERQKENA